MALSLNDHENAVPLAPLAHRNERVGDAFSGLEEVDDARLSREQVYHNAYNAERSTIPQADRGRQAWLFLAGCFCVEALLWGLPFSYGVFRDYYVNHNTFPGSDANLAIVGTVSSGIMYLGSIFVFVALKRYPYLSRWCNIVGLSIILLGLVAGSFATQLWQLILTQGALYGIGGTLMYSSCIVYLEEWFVERKGLAYGVMWAGTGVGGLAIPFITQAALDRYGFRNVLRGEAVVLALAIGPLTYYLKPRLPISQRLSSREVNLSFLSRREFWLYQIPSILQGLGYFLPGIYLPSYANDVGLPSYAGPLLLALVNAAGVPGTILFGVQGDRMHVTKSIVIITIGATMAVFLLWGLSTSLPALCIFSIVYGFFAGSFSTTWSSIIREMKRLDDRADSGIIFGALALGRGLGNVVSGPLSEVLLETGGSKSSGRLGYETSFSGLIVFVGVTAAFGGFSWFGRKAGWVR